MTLCEERQISADIILASSGRPLTDLECADHAVIVAESMLSTLCQSWLQPMDYVYALINASRRGLPRDPERESGLVELVDELCYLGFMMKNNGSYERDVQQRCAKATSAFNS
ncbi:hypothetical protein RB195_024048 [Necator americanus]|uniref:Uncharacterized protein n=1 Tax=Necator americanus TaxID=51031 RepID=A0ABR1ENW1_NECAM